MATCSPTVNCPVCFGPFVDPRTLPCSHTFCKKCLQQSGDQQSDNKLQCPVCRVECQIPANSADLIQHLQPAPNIPVDAQSGDSRDSGK